MTEKLAELIETLDKTGIEIDGQNLAAVKKRIQGLNQVPLRPLGFYVLIKMEKVDQTKTIEIDGVDRELYLMSDDLNARENEATSKGWILSFGNTAYRGFAGHGEDGMCDGPADWGLEVGDYVEFQSYGGLLSAFDHEDKTKRTLRLIPDSNIICKVEI